MFAFRKYCLTLTNGTVVSVVSNRSSKLMPNTSGYFIFKRNLIRSGGGERKQKAIFPAIIYVGVSLLVWQSKNVYLLSYVDICLEVMKNALA